MRVLTLAVDFSRELRYCLENGVDSTTSREFRTFSIEGLPHEFTETELPSRRIDGETTSRSPDVALPKIKDRINRVDPDVLVVDSVKLLGGLHDVADSIG